MSLATTTTTTTKHPENSAKEEDSSTKTSVQILNGQVVTCQSSVPLLSIESSTNHNKTGQDVIVHQSENVNKQRVSFDLSSTKEQENYVQSITAISETPLDVGYLA